MKKSSKVCTIANRLSKSGMNRSEAFKRAWELVNAPAVETKVSGVTFGKRQEALEHLTHYAPDVISVNLERESANEFDPNAVKVITTVTGKGGYCVGYLPRALAAKIAPLLDKGREVKAAFNGVRGKYQAWQNYGMAVSLSV